MKDKEARGALRLLKERVEYLESASKMPAFPPKPETPDWVIGIGRGSINDVALSDVVYLILGHLGLTLRPSEPQPSKLAYLEEKS